MINLNLYFIGFVSSEDILHEYDFLIFIFIYLIYYRFWQSMQPSKNNNLFFKCELFFGFVFIVENLIYPVVPTVSGADETIL